MRSRPISAALGPILLAASMVGATSTAAQEPDSVRTDDDALRVYLECSDGMGCDQREFRTEIDWSIGCATDGTRSST
jgi:hypothetical protein